MTDAYSKAAVGYERIREILRHAGEVGDLPGARRDLAPARAPSSSTTSPSATTRRSRFSGMSASKIQPGQLAAFIGPTGAGKTTIISLVPRFYDPISGVVKIDGIDVRRYTQRSLQRSNQLRAAGDRSVPGADMAEHRLRQARRQPRRDLPGRRTGQCATSSSKRCRSKYDTLVGERGVTLSGGQRQRIAIARAVIRNTPILILDEPSSGLDAESEKLVFEALDRLMKGKTSIVIAHRLSTIRSADVIFALKDGRIVETARMTN